ncbi:hypothetical protein, partial [Sphaerisporangium flaviroseum]|uniref:hypothetical protein n=1 Tax=Sphaerisporangium flaviroseum TaxID=509199 RepID=UPI0031EC62CF
MPRRSRAAATVGLWRLRLEITAVLLDIEDATSGTLPGADLGGMSRARPAVAAAVHWPPTVWLRWPS